MCLNISETTSFASDTRKMSLMVIVYRSTTTTYLRNGGRHVVGRLVVADRCPFEVTRRHGVDHLVRGPGVAVARLLGDRHGGQDERQDAGHHALDGHHG